MWRVAEPNEALIISGLREKGMPVAQQDAIAAHYLLGESVTVARWLGIGFIIVGVWLVARS